VVQKDIRRQNNDPKNESKKCRINARVTLRLAVYRQSVRLGDKSLETHDLQFYFSSECLQLSSLCNILSDERMGLSFTIAAGPRQRSHSQVRVPQPGRPGPRIHIPQEQGGPVILPGTGFPFRRLLRLAELQWRYWTPPPHGLTTTA
jgi:hypothetical protein